MQSSSPANDVPGHEVPGHEVPGHEVPGVVVDPAVPCPRRAAAGLGALVVAGAVVAAFTWSSRAGLSGDVVRGALESAFARGPSDGAWQVDESHGSRFRQFASDPHDPDRVLAYLRGAKPSEGDARRPGAERYEVRIAAFPRGHVAERVFGEAPPTLFLSNYRVESQREERVEGRRTVVVRFTAAQEGTKGPSRTVWLDRETRELVRLEDRAHDGSLVHGARRLSRTFVDWEPARLHVPRLHLRAGVDGPVEPGTPGDRGKPAGSRAGPSQTFEDVVALAAFPVYEPARLPPGFRRVGQAFHALPVAHASAAWGRPRPTMGLVLLRYSDGLARINLMQARTEHMRTIQEGLRRLARVVVDPAACPTTDADSPEDLLAGAHDVIVRRRSDRCSTVLQIDRIGGVAVVLSARNEHPPRAYAEAIASLEPAPGSALPDESETPIEWLRIDFRGRGGPWDRSSPREARERDSRAPAPDAPGLPTASPAAAPPK